MNAQRYVLPEIEVSVESVTDATRAVLHSILLCRALGEITPRAGQCRDYPTLSYAKCSEVDAEVEKIIDRLKRPNERQSIGPELSRVSIIVSFYERREKIGLLGFVSSEERFYWEHWHVTLIINERSGKKSAEELAREESNLRATLLRITALVNERTDHLPHSPGHDAVLPFEIKFASDTEVAKHVDSTWSLSRILQQARPPM